MKKFNIYTLALLSVAALGTVGCENVAIEEDAAPKDNVQIETVTITGSQNSATTKVAIEDGWDLSWEDGELIAGYSVDSYNEYWDSLYGGYNDNSALYSFTASNISADGNSASFTGSRVSDCELRLIYPYNEDKGASNYGFEYDIDLATVEVDPTNTDPYAAAKASMYMVSHDADVEDGADFTMEHITSYVEWVITNNEESDIELSAIVLTPSNGSSIKIPTSVELDLSKEYGASDFCSDKSYGDYTYFVNFTTPLTVADAATVNTSILPFVFEAGESIDVTIHYTMGGVQYYKTETKTNETGEDMPFSAGKFSKINCSTTDAVAIAPATISASVNNIELNAAQLVTASTNAVEIGYFYEESEELEDVTVDAAYVLKESNDDDTPDADGACTFDISYLSPNTEYTVYAYAINMSGEVVITDAVKFTTASLSAMTLTEQEITTTSVTFTPGYEDDYFDTIAYDCFLAEYSDHSDSFIITNGTKIYNNEDIKIEELEPGTEYIVRLAGAIKVGYNTYYTSVDLAFTTADLPAASELASKQVFTVAPTITLTSYNRNTLVFANDDYQIEFCFKNDPHYAPSLPKGTFELFDGKIINLSDNSEISCTDESEITITFDGNRYSFSGKMMTPAISKPAADTDNKYLEFECTDQFVYYPLKLVETEALVVSEKTYSFFIEDNETGSDFGLNLELDDALTPSTTNAFACTTDGSAISVQRYQAGKGNVLVDGECIYQGRGSWTFDVEYDSETGIYTLTNTFAETTEGIATIAQKLTIDPTNVAASEVAVDLTAITAASGESEGSGSGWDETWESEYNLSFNSDLFSTFDITIVTDDEEESSSTFPDLSCKDGEGTYSTTDDVTINCTLAGSDEPLTIKNSEIVEIENTGGTYSITVKFESTSNNAIYTATYSGAMYDGYSCDINDYTGSGDSGWGW